MEIALNFEGFETLDHHEMMTIDGGSVASTAITATCMIVGAVIGTAIAPGVCTAVGAKAGTLAAFAINTGVSIACSLVGEAVAHAIIRA